MWEIFGIEPVGESLIQPDRSSTNIWIWTSQCGLFTLKIASHLLTPSFCNLPWLLVVQIADSISHVYIIPGSWQGQNMLLLAPG